MEQTASPGHLLAQIWLLCPPPSFSTSTAPNPAGETEAGGGGERRTRHYTNDKPKRPGAAVPSPPAGLGWQQGDPHTSPLGLSPGQTPPQPRPRPHGATPSLRGSRTDGTGRRRAAVSTLPSPTRTRKQHPRPQHGAPTPAFPQDAPAPAPHPKPRRTRPCRSCLGASPRGETEARRVVLGPRLLRSSQVTPKPTPHWHPFPTNPRIPATYFRRGPARGAAGGGRGAAGPAPAAGHPAPSPPSPPSPRGRGSLRPRALLQAGTASGPARHRTPGQHPRDAGTGVAPAPASPRPGPAAPSLLFSAAAH